MPRFHFHLHHGVKAVPDLEGFECADAAAALAYAVRTVLEMLAEDVRQGRIDLGWRIDIVDPSGAAIRSLPFGEVLSGAHLTSRPDSPLRH